MELSRRMPVKLQVRALPEWAEVAGSSLAIVTNGVAQETFHQCLVAETTYHRAECRWDYIFR